MEGPADVELVEAVSTLSSSVDSTEMLEDEIVFAIRLNLASTDEDTETDSVCVGMVTTLAVEPVIRAMSAFCFVSVDLATVVELTVDESLRVAVFSSSGSPFTSRLA